jgi:hypothetical protein
MRHPSTLLAWELFSVHMFFQLSLFVRIWLTVRGKIEDGTSWILLQEREFIEIPISRI